MSAIYRFKNAVPSSWKQLYHRALSQLAIFVYGDPSVELIVVGVTGTNGKTTTSLMIAEAIEGAGVKTAAITTAVIKIADVQTQNTSKMTMPGRFALQRFLRKAVRAGCRYVVVETSSQGVHQHRHAGIRYDVAVFTNLTPEHIEAHGGFEAYKDAKLEFFRHTARRLPKIIDGKTIPKIAVVNADDEHAKDFELSGFDRVIRFGVGTSFEAKNVRDTLDGVSCEIADVALRLQTPGLPNTWNASAAIAVADAFGISASVAASRLAPMDPLPGRFEKINEGQDWTVLVDYAAEPVALGHLYASVASYPHKRIIHMLGSCGGGRDIARRPILGRLAGENADIVIVTNEDPYDDDPREIIEAVAAGAREAGSIEGQNLFLIDDRADAIRKAMELADAGDIVLLTGKGNEPWICVADGKKIPWDERAAARSAIQKRMVQ